MICACAVSLKESIGIVYQLSKEYSKENSEEIEKTCSEKVSIPLEIKRVDKIPLTSAGKMDRAGAAALF